MHANVLYMTAKNCLTASCLTHNYMHTRNWKTDLLRNLIKSTRYSILNLTSKAPVTYSWESEISLLPSEATLSSVDKTKSRPCWSNQSGRLAICYNPYLIWNCLSILLSLSHCFSLQYTQQAKPRSQGFGLHFH